MNLNTVDGNCFAQPEVNAEVVGGEITAAAENVATLPYAPACQIYGGPDGVVRALCASDEFQFHPVMVIRVHIAQQQRNGIDRVDDDIDLAIVEQVATSGAARRGHNGQSGSFNGGHHLKLAGFQVMKKQRALRVRRPPTFSIYFWVDMAIHDQQIFSSVVVVIEEAIAKSDERKSRRAHPDFEAD